ncbi:MAG: thioredoxin family protein [Flavobacteriales bacterium]|nr:thioredoxin family protein [Flavobacteriales bacterium]MDW8432106.1 thioredoxin family protein [Flavobacteriales bacterium]
MLPYWRIKYRIPPFFLWLASAAIGFYTNSTAQGYAIGDALDNFTLRATDGRQVALSDFSSHRGIIVVFTCNHCPFSQMYESRIIRLARTFEPRGMPLLAINPNDSAQVPEDSFMEMVKTARRKKYPFPYLHDPTQEVARRFGAARTPHVFVARRANDKFILVYKGAVDNDPEQNKGKAAEAYVEKVAEAILNGKEDMPYSEVKAVGCTIKWRKGQN